MFFKIGGCDPFDWSLGSATGKSLSDSLVSTLQGSASKILYCYALGFDKDPTETVKPSAKFIISFLIEKSYYRNSNQLSTF